MRWNSVGNEQWLHVTTEVWEGAVRWAMKFEEDYWSFDNILDCETRLSLSTAMRESCSLTTMTIKMKLLICVSVCSVTPYFPVLMPPFNCRIMLIAQSISFTLYEKRPYTCLQSKIMNIMGRFGSSVTRCLCMSHRPSGAFAMKFLFIAINPLRTFLASYKHTSFRKMK